MDKDADGYGDPASSACPHPEPDCDDSDKGVNPGSSDQCGDSIDNDCDGLPDDGCGDAAFMCMEAEVGAVVAPMEVGTDTAASGGSFVWLPDTHTTNDDGSVAFSLNVPQSGAYILWARVIAASTGSDSFHVSINGAEQDVWHALYGEQNPAWTWDRVSAQGNGSAPAPEKDPRVFALTAGVQEILFEGRERGTKLDRLLLTQDPDFIPEGVGACPTTPGACIDMDGDGYGAPASMACTHSGLDCDDTNSAIHPGAAEVCDGGKDDDCDGSTDAGDSDCSDLCAGITTCQDGDACCPEACGSASDSDCSNMPPVSCNGVTACVDGDGCCPEQCVGSDPDCSVTGTLNCTDDGLGGKVCSVTDVTGCHTTGSNLPWALVLLGTGLVGPIFKRRRRQQSKNN